MRKAKKKIADLDDVELYIAARKIADMVFEYVNENSSGKPDLEDRRESQGSNPFYDQTGNGFFLEMYYSLPNKLWTPWGQYGFGGSGGGLWDDVLPEILKRLGATIYKDVEYSEMGVFGPVYAIHRIDNIVLPEPVELEQSAYDSYEEVKNAWEGLTENYKKKK